MVGMIDVGRYMEDYSRFRGRQQKIEESNALWAYRVCGDKRAVRELYKEALDRAWGKTNCLLDLDELY